MRLNHKQSLRNLQLLHLDNDVFRLCLNYVSQNEKLAKLHQQSIFLKRCQKNNVFPPSINKIKLPSFMHDRCNQNALHRIKRTILSRCIRSAHRNIHIIRDQIRQTRSLIPYDTLTLIDPISNNAYFWSKRTNKTRLIRKYLWITTDRHDDTRVFANAADVNNRNITTANTRDSTSNNITSPSSTNARVSNLTSLALTSASMSVLSKGPKFNITSKFTHQVENQILVAMADLAYQARWRSHLQNVNTLTSSDTTLHLPFDRKPTPPPICPDDLRVKLATINTQVKQLIESEKRRMLPCNLTPNEITALKSMKNDSNIYLPSDKGGEFVVISSVQYVQLGRNHLSDTSIYTELPRDTTEAIRKDLNKLTSNIFDRRKLPRHLLLKLLTQHCRTQQFYHLIKTHKRELKIRPIISAVGGPFDRIGWMLSYIISPLLSHVPAHLKNSAELLASLNNIHTHERAGKVIISLDVESMYTNIPINDAINIVCTNLSTYNCNLYGFHVDDIKSLLTIVLNNNVFHFEDHFYRQHHGLAMGSRIAPVLAILSLDYLERNTIFSNPPVHITFYKRYVDDTLAIVNNLDEATTLTNYLNNQHPSIRFELELPTPENIINILDLKIKLNSDGNIDTSFYEKSAKKGIIIHQKSSQPISMKTATIKSELKRIEDSCTTRDAELNAKCSFNRKLHENGYSNRFINSLNRTTPAPASNNNPIYLSVPFVSDNFQRKLKRILRAIDLPINIVNKSNNTLRQNLSRIKYATKRCNKRQCHVNDDHLCFRSNVVYKITCLTCSDFYIGSTIQFLHDRISHHHTSQRSAIFEHNNKHPVTPIYTYNVLQQCRSLKELRFTEAVLINRLRPSLNRQHECNDVMQFLI